MEKSKINIQNFTKEIENWKKLKSENIFEIIDISETKEYYF